ncbi:MAG: hypothetical protein ACR2OO_03800 [Thermomicrobiales bacterium]
MERLEVVRRGRCHRRRFDPFAHKSLLRSSSRERPDANCAPSSAAPIFRPAPFAGELGGYAAYEMADHPEPGALDFLAPAEQADFNRWEAALYAAVPELRSATFDHPIHKLQEAAVAWACEMYSAGVRHGAACEALRRELVGPLAGCPARQAHGWMADDGKQASSGRPAVAVCALCAGTGTMTAEVLEAHRRAGKAA